MKYTLDMSHTDHLETRKDVRFMQVITVPVLKDGKNSGVVIHVGITGLGLLTLENCSVIPAGLVMDVAGRLMLADEMTGAEDGSRELVRELVEAVKAFKSYDINHGVRGLARTLTRVDKAVAAIESMSGY